MFKIIIPILLFIFSTSESKRILGVFPTPSISHQVVFRPLMQELAKRGHEVTVITPNPAFPKGKTPQNLTEIDVHDISYEIFNKYYLIERGKSAGQLEQVKVIYDLLNTVFEAQVKTHEVQKLINDKQRTFDLLFTETCVRPALSFSYLYNAPVIEFSSLSGMFGTFETAGAAVQPLIYPIPTQKRIYNLTIWEKISGIYSYYTYMKMYADLEIYENDMLKKLFGPNIPTLAELKANVQMLFLNVHPIWDFNRPVPPNVIYLGGFHQKQVKTLPKDLLSYLDSSKHGVIYLSFGTNVKPSLLPSEKLRIFTEAFSQLPYEVLWKWDKDELSECPKNVKISKWYPQSDLLNHPKIKLFITQGGLQSTDEAIAAGVPVIGIPLLIDQWFNTEQYVIHNIGVKLNLETLTVEELTNSIKNLINNPSYRENILSLRNLMYDRPLQPLDQAVWWTEYVLRHGGAARLKAAAANMHWTDYYEIDLVLLFCSAIFTFGVVIILAIYFLIKLKFYRRKLKIH